MDKFIGKTLNDRYILTEIVGVGGMAVVYKAFDQVVNRVVAVKILKEEFMSDAQFRRRFANESRAITMLSQNNIVDVYDVCLEGDLMYLVMEYIDGITLKEYLDKVKVLEWHEASFYIKQILKAMSHAHERGIVHRDIKPHNIMLLRDGTIKVTDFGIAKLTKFDTQTITDKAIGSVHYISPEQASGDRTDEKTDIYSVGVMFYEMLTGTLPFIGDSAVSVALMQVQAQPKLPREINENIPEGIEEVVIKAMMKDPASRYSSALSMFNDIVSVEETPDITFGYLYGEDVPVDEADAEEGEEESLPLFSDFEGEEEPALEESDLYENGDEEEEAKEESKFKSTWLPIICGAGSAIVVVFLVVFGIIFFPEINEKVASATKPAVMVKVENYVGQDYDTVFASKPENLLFERENVISDQKAGTIISQTPAPDTEVEEGSVITFTVSIGEETVSIPDLINMHYDVAISQLKVQGIQYTTKFISSDSIKENYVVRTSPGGGEEATSDTVVTIYISTGPEIVTKTVPDLINNSEADAVEKLSAEGLKADKKYQYNDSVPKDCVISQSPAADSKVEEGSSVVIEISLGPKPEEKPDTEKPSDDENEKPDTEKPSDDETTKPDTEKPSDDETTKPDTEKPSDDTTTVPDEETTTGGDTTNPDNDTPTDTEPTDPDTDTPTDTEPTDPDSETDGGTSDSGDGTVTDGADDSGSQIVE